MLKRIGVLLLFTLVSLAHASDKSEVEAEMESLTEYALEQALQAIASEGAVYPFALIRNTEGRNALLRYSGDLDKLPPAEDYARTLYKNVAVTVRQSASAEVAVIVRQIVAPVEGGDVVPGVWVLVDHRLAEAPRVVFQPLVPGKKKGELVPGTPVVQGSTDNLFPRMAGQKK